MLDDKYKKAFLEEAFEFVESANQLILYLEKDPTNESTINELFRIMHSLKSEAGLLGFSTIMEISHILEDLFDNFRKKKLPISNETINIILKAIDFINDSLNSISATSEEITETDIIDKLKQAYLSIQGGGKIEKKSSISEQEKKEKEESFLLDDLEISFGKPIDFANIKQQFILSDFETHLIESEKATY
ncbi:MAG TPA: Hpt domain-containing protein, partial [Exilispira sp.]|nr:Hpt domain-containing protein [Exilispira sp.]